MRKRVDDGRIDGTFERHNECRQRRHRDPSPSVELGLVVRARLQVNGAIVVEDPTYPFAFHALDWPAGAYELLAEVEDIAGKRSLANQTIYIGAQSDPIEWPRLSPDALEPHLEDQTGDPVSCASHAQCYGGTQCIDGVCLRAQPLSCELGSASRSGHGWTMTWLGLLLLGAYGVRRR